MGYAHSSLVARACKFCGSEFLAKPAEIRLGRAHYCSRKCMCDGMTTAPIERFKKYLGAPDENGCIPWLGNCHPRSGHGVFYDTPTRVQAHRFAYALAYGEFDNKLCVCHRCDNPPCVNPEHLFLGTQKDNLDDMRAKKRHAVGAATGRARLTESNVIEIRSLLSQGLYQHVIAAKFGVSQKAVFKIAHGLTWKHVG